uniref:Uncharacterized protein n=1 Tax=Meloidogyne enterolobii TaxID=390850 RepID=A0A6V7UCQ9_MELEN|nr:unnamed protein product [Meloidogyne enterolobii]
MLVYKRDGGQPLESKDFEFNFEINYIPINEGKLDKYSGDPFGQFKGTKDYFVVGIYEEVIKNHETFNDLYQQGYDIGIAEFNVMAGAFALFEALNIKNTFNVSASILLPSYLQFLNINVKEFHIPGYFLNFKI